jgi:methylenetetrahydrofolate--tRNA-(uracil-5-)-methyltransferase
MNVNFGLFPPIEGRAKKADRKRLYTKRAEAALKSWLADCRSPVGPAEARALESVLLIPHSPR